MGTYRAGISTIQQVHLLERGAASCAVRECGTSDFDMRVESRIPWRGVRKWERIDIDIRSSLASSNPEARNQNARV